jgi:hypothetical protein
VRLTLIGWLSAAGYAVAAFALPQSNRTAHVVAFVGLFGLLFVLAGAALAPARTTRTARAGARSRVGTILLFAGLFRLLLVPAGLSAPLPLGEPGTASGRSTAPSRLDSRIDSLVDDLAGRRVGYDRHLLYDDDVWRYLWDGHVAAGGLDPYLASPRAIEAAAESGNPTAGALLEDDPWWDVLDNVGFPTYRTVYPPAAQLLFRGAHAVAPGSVAFWKLLMALLDLGTCLLLVRILGLLERPREEVLLYAWNPLAIKELAGSGHVDALMIFLVVLAVERLLAAGGGGEGRSGRQIAGLGAWAGAAVAKLGALVLAPLVARRTRARWWWTAPAVLALLALPYRRGLPSLVDSLAIFGREWVANAGVWAAVRWSAEALGAASPETWAHALTRGALLGLIGGLTWAVGAGGSEDVEGGRRFVHAAFLALAAAVLLSPAVMPWYLLWALPLAVAAGYRSWWLLTGLSLLYYLVYATHTEALWWRWAEHGGFALAFAWEVWRNPGLAAELWSLIAPWSRGGPGAEAGRVAP